VDNWREIYADLINADGVDIAEDAEALSAAFIQALAIPAEASARADRARHVVAADEGALSFAVGELITLLP
jgi:3-deoxy-D-manno-octulosonic-acid transferase